MSQQSNSAPLVAAFLVLLLLAAGGGWYILRAGQARQMAAIEQARLMAEEATHNARQAQLMALEQAKAAVDAPPRASSLPLITPAKSAAESAQPTSSSEVPTTESIIRDKLAAQQAAWNEGDIDKFMEVYWQSEQLTFASGGKVTRGWQSTLEGYKTRYPDKATMGQLTFDQLEFKPIDSEVMLVIGNWHLTREKPIGGKFSLIWQQRDGQWVIVHDHTSLSE